MKKLCILLIILLLIFYSITRSNFMDYYKININLIYNILPTINKEYLASIIPSEKNQIGDLIHSYSINSDEWKGPLENSNPEFKTIIVDLSYDKDQKLLCIGMQRIERVTIFNLYKKETNDIKSKWVKIESNENIRSIIYDTDGILLGCHGDNGQIYKKENTDINSKWKGPINYDIPMKKIIYDKDNILLGIGLIDHRIYKKSSNDWVNSKWDRNNFNKQRVFDIFHDYDGCLIASSYQGIIKQVDRNYLSSFIPISKSVKRDNILDINDIILFKTGINFEEKDLGKNKIKLNNSLDKILNFKELAIKMCKDRHTKSRIANKNLLKINKQKEMMDEVSELISQVRKKL